MSDNLTVLGILEVLERGETLTEEQVRPLEWAIGESIGYRWLTDISDTNKSMLVAPDIAQHFVLTGQFIDGKLGQPSDQFSLVKPNWFNTFFLTSELAWAIVEKWMAGRHWYVRYGYAPDCKWWWCELDPDWDVAYEKAKAHHHHRLTAACIAFARARGLGSP